MEVGADEVESDVEPQDDYNGLSDSDESDFAQDVADASEDIGDIGDDDEQDIEETPPSSGGAQDKVEPLIKVGDNPRPSRFLSTGRCRHTCLLTISWGKAVQLYSNGRCSTLLVYVYTQMV